MLNAILGIGGSLISGLFGSKKRKEVSESTSVSTIDYKGLADAAIAGGFNPLTAIRTGGASGFVTTKTNGTNTSSGGGPSVGAAIGDAIASAGANNLFGSFNSVKNDPIKLKSKTSGAVRSLVGAQVVGASRSALNVQPLQRMQRSPVTSRPPLPGLAATPLPKQAGPNRYVRAYDDVLGRDTWSVSSDGPEFDQLVAAGLLTAADYAAQKSRDAVSWWERQKVIANYRTMSKRPIVNNRPPPPSGYRYAP